MFEKILDRVVTYHRIAVAVLGMVTIVWYIFSSMVISYADSTFDKMLLERGISKETFKSMQDKLGEVDRQTDGLKGAVAGIQADLDGAARQYKLDEQNRVETRKQVNDIYDYLIRGANGGRSP